MQAFGLNPEIVIKFLKEILKSNKVVSFDIAEVSPRFDHDKRTAILAAIIVYAIINGLIENKQKKNKIMPAGNNKNSAFSFAELPLVGWQIALKMNILEINRNEH